MKLKMKHILFTIIALSVVILEGVTVSSGSTAENEKLSNSFDREATVSSCGNQKKQSTYDMERLKRMISEKALEDVFQSCQGKLKQREELEIKLARKGRVIKTTNRKADPSLIRNRYSDPNIQKREKSQLVFEEATASLNQRYDLTKDDIGIGLPQFPLTRGLSKSSQDSCETNQPQPTCDRNSRYRTADGSCNNLNNPTWGMASSCQPRLLSAFYEGTNEFRTSVNGGPLPAPRQLSLNLHYHLNRPTNYVTHMFMFFGQLLDHDIALTPFTTTVDNEPIDCCPPETETHPQCRPIIIQRNDPFYSQFGVTCLNFVRSVVCPTCNMGYRQLMNSVTSFIDASFVYANSQDETQGLRANDGTGRLRTQNSNNGPLLPRSPDPQVDQCSFPETNDICFQAGDARANQHNVLTSLHTIFMREHNRLATELGRINPRWNDERRFQEARRILGAQMQVITYKEYLPITLGPDRMRYFNLYISDRGTTAYEQNDNAAILMEFSTAAFRFGHSLVNSVVANSPMNSTNGRRLLRNEFFQPFDLYNGIIGPLVSGASNSPAQWFEQNLVEDVTNFLYRIRGNQTGLDLASININRGRDHGIPPYVNMVRWCSEGQIQVRTFNDLVTNNLMRSEQASALSRNYRNVADVDLWPGILMEIPNDNAVVGPTAACIIGLQYHHLKFGDRFYFEHRNQVGSFTYDQIVELRKTTLSKIMCLNSDARQLPLNAMIFRSRNNPLINCGSVTGVDLSYWRE